MLYIKIYHTHTNAHGQKYMHIYVHAEFGGLCGFKSLNSSEKTFKPDFGAFYMICAHLTTIALKKLSTDLG